MTKYISIAVTMLAFSIGIFGQESSDVTKTVTLEARNNDAAGKPDDNYERATFSFKYGLNGPEGRRLTRNNWDIYYSARGEGEDLIDVTTVVDDRSKILDLGKLDWTDTFSVPALPAYEKPTRHPKANAKVGHIYLVHTADSETDHYTLFRVENIDSGKSMTISWKLIPEPIAAEPAK